MRANSARLRRLEEKSIATRTTRLHIIRIGNSWQCHNKTYASMEELKVAEGIDENNIYVGAVINITQG